MPVTLVDSPIVIYVAAERSPSISLFAPMVIASVFAKRSPSITLFAPILIFLNALKLPTILQSSPIVISSPSDWKLIFYLFVVDIKLDDPAI